MATLKDVQDGNFNLLIKFDELCKKHRLQYYLIGGTLLGAVRHRDFIPWDDDVDLVMMRADYDNLLRIPTDEYPKGCHLSTPSKREGFLDFVIRLADSNIKIVDRKNGMLETEIGIDIFIIDNSFKSNFRFKINTYHRLYLYALARGHRRYDEELHVKRHRFVMKIAGGMLGFIGKRMSLQKIIDKYDRISTKGDSETYCIFSNDEPRLIHERYPKSCFSETVMLPIRDCEFPAPVGYKEILEMEFGDYMELPPEDARRPEHWDLYDESV